MTVKSSRWMVTCAAAVAVLAGSPSRVFAQQPSEQRIQELIRQAAARLGQTPTTPSGQAGTQIPNVSATQPPANTVRLTLDDAVKLALDHNLDIAVQRLNPELSDIQIASIQSVYRPSLTSQLATQSQTTPSTSIVSGSGVAAAPVVSGVSTYNGGVAQNVPWGGGNFSVSLNNNKQTSNNNLSLFNPTYNTNWSGQFTQPLLRNRSIDGTRQQLQVTKLNRDVSDIQLQATITNTLSNVRNAYWDYVFAVQSVDVAKQSVDLANKLVQDNQTRVQVGTMAPIDVVQAQAQAATAVQNLVTAQASVRTAELALKRLIVAGTQDPNWNATIDPVDRPDFQPEAIDVEAAVRRAISQRSDLAIARKDVQMNDITLKYLRDQLLPQADFQATYGFVGVGGTQLVREGTSFNSPIVGTIPGGYANALSSLWGGGYPRWTFALNLSYPLGTSAQEAAVARARVQLNQIDAQLKQAELQVATDVTNAAVTEQSNIERVQAAQAARELAQRQLDAENSKFAVGMSTNYFVVQAQNQLATAQNNELQAILNYRKSQVELERLQQTTLSSLNITLLSTAGAVAVAAPQNANTAATATAAPGR